MWQKARIVWCVDEHRLEGKELWVCGNPTIQECYITSSLTGERWRWIHPALLTNILGPLSKQLWCTLKCIELLGRPEDFAEEVPLVPLQEWANLSKEEE